jgi:hypothetical protein
MSGAIPPLPQYAFMAWCSVIKSTRITLPFTFINIIWGDQIKDRMGGGCSIAWRKEMLTF